MSFERDRLVVTSERYGDEVFVLTCSVCGSLVNEVLADKHANWHLAAKVKVQGAVSSDE